MRGRGLRAENLFSRRRGDTIYLAKNMNTFTLTTKEKSVLQKLPIEALVLFGSQAQGTARKGSDYDFGVLPSRPLTTAERKKVYDSLYDFLSGKIQQLVNIDIVFLPGASMELQTSAAAFGIPLYERTSYAFVRFRERVMDAEADFAPLRRLFHQAILARIP